MTKGYSKEKRTCPHCGFESWASQIVAHIKYRHDTNPDDRLWAKVDKKGPNGCWVYNGTRDRRGYGRPGRADGPGGETKRYYAHRRSYEIHKGAIPSGMLVLHTCDNPPCCNPDHLFLGTDADNKADAVSKHEDALRKTDRRAGARDSQP